MFASASCCARFHCSALQILKAFAAQHQFVLYYIPVYRPLSWGSGLPRKVLLTNIYGLCCADCLCVLNSIIRTLTSRRQVRPSGRANQTAIAILILLNMFAAIL